MPGLCAPEDDSPALFSYARLYLACRRTKRNSVAALAFEARQELDLIELRDELQSRRYRPSPSACFVTTRPKLREILAADFRDRVVHHLLIGAIEPDWERVFIHDSYACRRGKGVHQAVDCLQTFLLRATANGTREAWYLQLDHEPAQVDALQATLASYLGHLRWAATHRLVALGHMANFTCNGIVSRLDCLGPEHDRRSNAVRDSRQFTSGKS